MNASSSLAILLVAGGVLLGTVCPCQATAQLVGGYSEASTTNAEVSAAAQFAVKAQAAMPNQKTVITLGEILSSRQQVVAGMNYRLRLKVKVDGTDKEAEVVVWRKLSGEHELTLWAWITQRGAGQGQKKDEASKLATSKSVVVNGLRFEAMTDAVWTAPAKGQMTKITIQLRVTNESGKALGLRNSYCQADVLFPRLVEVSSGRVIKFEMGCRNGTARSKVDRLADKESLIWTITDELGWSNRKHNEKGEWIGYLPPGQYTEELRIAGNLYSIQEPVRFGSYTLTIPYANNERGIAEPRDMPKEPIDEIWVGEAMTSPAEFSIVQKPQPSATALPATP